jgi:nucleoside phosphorylase
VIIPVLVLAVLAGCGSDDCDPSSSPPPPRFAVFSAFPAELAPLLEQVAVETTEVVNGRTFRIGTLGGVEVVLGLTGIGLVNAEETTRQVLERFDVTGVVVSAVAGSPQRIGDVVVPVEWRLPDGTSSGAHRPWLTLVQQIGDSGDAPLERCTIVRTRGNEEVCMPFMPAIFVGGIGSSDDPFGGEPFPCQMNDDEVFGCDVVLREPSMASLDEHAFHPRPTGVEEPPAVEDMETAAIAAEAVAHGVPFIAFRGVSDGAEDPLGLPGFPAQFFAYYNLAARNAAAAAITFLERIADS